MSDPVMPGPLQGRRILVVEDDYVLAEDIRCEMEEQGAELLGPVARVASALELLSGDRQPDAAVLDVNLGGEWVYPVADVLLSRGIPFVFVTGYSRSALPEAYGSIGCCEKPVNMSRLVQELAVKLPPPAIGSPGASRSA